MKLKLTHLLSLIATSFVAMTPFSHAGNDNAQMRNLENRVTALEQRKGASGMINPQGRPQIRDGADLFVYGDLLVWNAHENGLQLAVKNTGVATNIADSEVKNIHGKWNPGFRVGIGYNTPHDGWDLRLTWLRFTDNGHKSAFAHAGQFIFPTRVPPAGFATLADYATQLKGYWSLNLNQLDLDLGREFFVSKWLTLRPHAGVRTDWVRQRLNANYKNFGAVAGTSANTSAKDHWFGFGVEGGLDTQWGLGRGWSLFADLSGAILYGYHKITQEVSTTTVAGAASTLYEGLKDSYRVSHPTLDTQIGVRWDNMFCNDQFHIGLQIGWEHHVYFSQNQFPLFVDDTAPGVFTSNQGDLTLQGWTFAARFDF